MTSALTTNDINAAVTPDSAGPLGIVWDDHR